VTNSFADYLRSRGLSARSALEYERAVKLLLEGHPKGKSASRHTVLAAAAKHYQEWSGEPLPYTPATRAPKGRLKPALSIPDEDWRALYAKIPNTVQGAVVRVMMATGLRIGDVLRLPPKAIREALGRADGLLEVRVKGGKGIVTSVAGARDEWERLLGLCGNAASVARAVAPYGDGSPEGGHAAYQAVRRSLQATGARLVAGRVHLHRLRRTVTVQALRSGAPLTTVQQMLGHADIRTTSSYADETRVDLVTEAQKGIQGFRR